MKLKHIVAVLGIAFPGLAFADSWGQYMVLDVTTENMPSYVTFQLASQPGGCQPSSSHYMTFASSNPDTVKAVYAMLMAAVLTGKAVWVNYVWNNQCQVTAVHGVY
jgi:hypothetical protein